jgi:hypothetical protein
MAEGMSSGREGGSAATWTIGLKEHSRKDHVAAKRGEEELRPDRLLRGLHRDSEG